jgi:hypothetical protein
MQPGNATGVYAIMEALKGSHQTEPTALSSGDNTITPPTTADFAIIELDGSSSVVVNLSSSTTDALKLSRLTPTVLSCDFLTTTTFNLESVGAGSNVWIRYGRVH